MKDLQKMAKEKGVVHAVSAAGTWTLLPAAPDFAALLFGFGFTVWFTCAGAGLLRGSTPSMTDRLRRQAHA